MLMDDHRPNTKPSGPAATGSPASTASLGDLTGRPHFNGEAIVYDQMRTREMQGDVRIVHPAPDAASEPFTNRAQRVTAEFETKTLDSAFDAAS